MKLKDMFKKGQISSDYPKKNCLQNLGLGQACSYPYVLYLISLLCYLPIRYMPSVYLLMFSVSL